MASKGFTDDANSENYWQENSPASLTNVHQTEKDYQESRTNRCKGIDQSAQDNTRYPPTYMDAGHNVAKAQMPHSNPIAKEELRTKEEYLGF